MKVTIQDSRTSVTVEPRDFRVTVSGARGPQGDAGVGIAAGGTEGQILAKASATDYDTEWIDNFAPNVEVYVKNSSGSPMTKGQIVYISGADGTNPTISLAIATSEMGSSKTIGWLKQDLAQGSFGYVITEGLLEGINTNSAGAAGDPVWLSPTTAGGVVYGLASKPSAPNHLVFLGYVLRKQINNGKVYVKVQNGFELGELHDVYNGAKTTPVADDALLLRDSADSNLWKRLTWTNAIAGVKSHMDTFKSVAGGYASLDGSGKVPASELPSYVDDVVEVANYAALPGTGETGKIYVTLDDNKCYRWSGSVYVEISAGGAGITLTTTGTSGAATLVGSTLNIPQYQGVLTNPVTGTGTAGQVAYFSGTSAVTGSNNLYWDAANGRFGINESVPTAVNHIQSNSTSVITQLIKGIASQTSDYVQWQNSSGQILGGVKADQIGRLYVRNNDGTQESNINFNTINLYTNRLRIRSNISSNEIFSFSGTLAILNGATTFDEQCVISNDGPYPLSKSSGNQDGLVVKNRINQSGTASFRMLVVNPTLTATGSGEKVLMSLGSDSTEVFKTYTGGNTVIGTNAASARLHVRGSGTTSATTALLVQNSTPTALLTVRDDGRIQQTIPGSTGSTIFGTNAGNSASLTGTKNTFYGSDSGFNVTTSSDNTFIGEGTAYFIGASSNRNIFLGAQCGIRTSAGSNLSSSSNSVLIGYDARANAVGQTNQIVIGHEAIGNGSNTATLGNTSITATYLRGNINYTDGGNFVIGTTTGTKIGTATNQLIGLWNATPIAQPTTAVAAATRVGGAGNTVTDTDTFDGYTIAQLVKALRNMGALA